MSLWLWYICGVAALVIAAYLLPASTSLPIEVEVQDRARATLDLLLETTKLIAALNTAVVGAAAALAIKGKEWSRTWGRFESVLVLICFFAAAVSYLGIYLSQVAALGMVYQGGLYLFEARLYMGFRLQFYGMLAGVICVGLVFIRLLEGRIAAATSAGHMPPP